MVVKWLICIFSFGFCLTLYAGPTTDAERAQWVQQRDANNSKLAADCAKRGGIYTNGVCWGSCDESLAGCGEAETDPTPAQCVSRAFRNHPKCTGQQPPNPQGGGGDKNAGKPEDKKPGDPASKTPEEQAKAAEAQQKKEQEATASTQADELEAALKKCKEQKQQATSCCNNPTSCILGRDPEVTGAFQTLATLVAVGAPALLAGDQVPSFNQDGSINQQETQAKMQRACRIMQLAGYGTGALNAGVAGYCGIEKRACESTCGEIVTKADTLQKSLSCGSSSSGSVCSKLNGVRVGARDYVQSCSYLAQNIEQAGQQAIMGATGGQIAGLCGNMSAAGLGFANLDRNPVYNTDCNDPANKANPICVNCEGANALNNPMCPQQSLGDGYGSGGAGFAGSRATYTASKGDGLNVSDLDNVAHQQAVTPTVPGEGNKTSGVSNNSGGGMGGGSGSGGNVDGGGGGGQGPGYNTDVMQGASGGNGFSGYSTANVATSDNGGGYSYGGGGGDNKRAANGIDLKQFLPGGAKAVAGRGLASANFARMGGSGELSLGDIFDLNGKLFVSYVCDGRRPECNVARRAPPRK